MRRSAAAAEELFHFSVEPVVKSRHLEVVKPAVRAAVGGDLVHGELNREQRALQLLHLVGVTGGDGRDGGGDEGAEEARAEQRGLRGRRVVDEPRERAEGA